MFDQAQLLLNDSVVSGNHAKARGGGVAAYNSTKVTITGASRVLNNSALSGGGLSAWDDASALVYGSSSLGHNTAARSGGGLAAFNSSIVTVTGTSSVYGNTARTFGGGLAAWDESRVTITGGSRVYNNAVETYQYREVGPFSLMYGLNNNASESGGGLSVAHKASVTITGDSLVYQNVAADYGGGLSALDDASVTVTGGSVYNNKATAGGGLAMFGSASVTITGAGSVYNNTAAQDGGGLCAGDNATVTVTGGSSVYNNSDPIRGGGLSAWGNTRVTVTGASSVFANTAGFGAGVFAGGTTSIIVTGNSTFYGNTAMSYGGGLRAEGNASLTVTCGTHVSNNTAMSGGGLSVGDLNGVASVTVSSGSVVDNNTATVSGGGISVEYNAFLTIIDASVINNSAAAFGGALDAREGTTAHVGTDVVFANNKAGDDSIVTMKFGNPTVYLPLRGDLTRCSQGVTMPQNMCLPGEFIYDACMCCPPSTFTFTNRSDDASVCQPCPSNAVCLGGALVDPKPGYWHSFNRSLQMHRCPLFTESCASDKNGSWCREGYWGNLCGACQLPKFGMLSPFRCGRCMRAGTQFGVYAVFCLVTIAFVTYTVHETWKESKDSDQSVRHGDLIKVLVQFLQYNVIISSMPVPWPTLFDLKGWFQAASVVFGPSSGQSLSLDCWLHQFVPQGPGKLPLAIQRTLVYFVSTFGMFLGVVVLQCVCSLLHVVARKLPSRQRVRARPPRFLTLHKLPVTALVMAYYAYPTLVRAALSFFSCMRIDRGVAEYWQPGYPAPLNSTHRYWTLDIQQECFAGWHLRWALGLGLPAVLLLCVVVPIVMGVGLKLNESKADVEGFRRHFGFFYRNYRPECIWWEAVWAAQTVVLTVVTVFSFPMQQYLSVVTLLLVFWASASLQMLCRPYAMPSLHRMHIISTSCLAATTFGALFVFAYEVQEESAQVLRNVVAVCLLCLNVGFVGWCAIMLTPAAKHYIGVVVKWLTLLWALLARQVPGAKTGRSQHRVGAKSHSAAV